MILVVVGVVGVASKLECTVDGLGVIRIVWLEHFCRQGETGSELMVVVFVEGGGCYGYCALVIDVVFLGESHSFPQLTVSDAGSDKEHVTLEIEGCCFDMIVEVAGSHAHVAVVVDSAEFLLLGAKSDGCAFDFGVGEGKVVAAFKEAACRDGGFIDAVVSVVVTTVVAAAAADDWGRDFRAVVGCGARSTYPIYVMTLSFHSWCTWFDVLDGWALGL